MNNLGDKLFEATLLRIAERTWLDAKAKFNLPDAARTIIEWAAITAVGHADDHPELFR